jgi:hypothetical protein
MRKDLKTASTKLCTHCFAEIPHKASACPECGSDDETGWSENTVYDNLGIPDYEDIENDFLPARHRVSWPMRIIAITMLLGMLTWVFL